MNSTTKLRVIWSPAERGAWAPPEDITVSEWAARYRVLPKQSAISGLWSNRLGPYAMGVMDAFTDSRVERLTIMASVQSMKTEAVYNMLGYAICQDPAPALIVMPTLKTLKRVNKRIRDMLFASPELSSHLTGNPDDLKIELILLDRMEIYFATAGSPADLQNVEARYIILDETDEYVVGPEGGSPIEMAVDRSTTYWNRKIIMLSRPTRPEGFVNLEYERSDQRKFWVPCPLCGGYQVLSFWQVKHKGATRGEWPRDKRNPEYIKHFRVARYECLHCGGEIDDKDKPAMLARGKWVPEGWPISREGEMAPPPLTSHVGFWWNALYSPFRNFSEIAAQFFATKPDREKYQVFVTQWLAEPWKEVVRILHYEEILQLRTERPPLVVPAGTIALTAGIDMQKSGFWMLIRAWLLEPDPVGHLVRYGYLESWEDLERWLFLDVYQAEDGSLSYPVWRAGIDIGGGEGEVGDATRTEQVYEWLRRSGRGRVFGVKGAARALPGGKKMHLSLIDKMPGKGRPIPGGIRLWHLDTNLIKDAIMSRMESGKFWLHAETGEEYAAHLKAEAKERDHRGRVRWMVQGRKPNHLWDCEVYAAAMADPECWGGIMVLPRPGQGPEGAGPEPEQPEAEPSWYGGRVRQWFRR